MVQLVELVLFLLVTPGIFGEDNVRVTQVCFDQDLLLYIDQNKCESRAVFPVLLVGDLIFSVEGLLDGCFVRLY